jgi:ABC-type bacteriocin/lantibiotic exporter with double-glycine peptidase domain
MIEENGFNLSGGERQRIVLARTLLQGFDILIIDEGLNQVDISLERKILKKLNEKYKNKTIIVISHRLNNKDMYDKVVKLQKGKLLTV